MSGFDLSAASGRHDCAQALGMGFYHECARETAAELGGLVGAGPRVYVLFETEPERLYIGQTLEFGRRIASHFAHKRVPTALAWRAIESSDDKLKDAEALDRLEVRTVTLAEKLELPLVNICLRSKRSGETSAGDFEAACPIEREAALVLDSTEPARAAGSVQAQSALATIEREPAGGAALAAAHEYLRRTLGLTLAREWAGEFWFAYAAQLSNETRERALLRLGFGILNLFQVTVYGRTPELAWATLAMPGEWMTDLGETPETLAGKFGATVRERALSVPIAKVKSTASPLEEARRREAPSEKVDFAKLWEVKLPAAALTALLKEPGYAQALRTLQFAAMRRTVCAHRDYHNEVLAAELC